MENFRYIWVGFHQEGQLAFEALLDGNVRPSAVITLTEEAKAKRSGSIDYQALCERAGIPFYAVEHINAPNSLEIIRKYAPSVIFVIGWSQLLSPEVLACASMGVIGAHASLLPKGRGSAPINWALINGQTATGNSLIWLEEEVDGGALIDQIEFPISDYDTCETLYQRVAESNREMIFRLLPSLLNGDKPGKSQEMLDEPILSRRRPKDGLIDWTLSARQIYNLIRAVTNPYPGAFSFIDGKRWIIWKAALLSEMSASNGGGPGGIIGKMVSPEERACGLVVVCGDNSQLVILEMEDASGRSYRGRNLSEIDLIGKIFSDQEA